MMVLSDAELLVQAVLDAAGGLEDLLMRLGRGERLDHDHVGLVDVQHEIPLAVGEEPLDDLHGGNVGVFGLPDEQDGARLVGDKMQLLGAHVHVAGQDIVGDDVLDESSLVVLFLVIAARLVKGHGGDGADRPGRLVGALHKSGEIHLAALGAQRGIAPAAGANHLVCIFELVGVEIVEPGADDRQLAAGHDKALLIHDPDGAVDGVLHLNNHILEDSAGHMHASYILR